MEPTYPSLAPRTLSVIIVSWNTAALLRRALDSIYAGKGSLVLEVIVVDNGSTDGSRELVMRDFPEVRLLTPDANTGFSGGNNLGLQAAQGEWLMLLNPDTELVGDALPALLSFLDQHPEVGVVGPELRYTDGTHQPSRRRFPSLPTLFLESTPLAWLLGPLRARYSYTNRPRDRAQAVDWLVGAALLLRREVCERVGGLDERFFMYFEECDWQRRIKAAGWSIWYVPEARVIHHESASSVQVPTQRHIRFNRSRIRYAAKWHGSRWATLLALWLWLLFAWQSGVEGVKWLLGHKRPLRAARRRSYRDVRRALWAEVGTQRQRATE